MSRNFRIKLALSLMLVLLVCVEACAKTGQEYQRSWNDSFGVADPQSKINIQSLWYEVQKVIDEIGNDYSEL